MCFKVIFEYNQQDIEVDFSDDDAKLPVLTKEGDIHLLGWGHRMHQAGNFPVGAMALFDEIYSQPWRKLDSLSVKLPIKSFMVNNVETKNHWYHLNKKRCLQGLLAKHKNEFRVYIVTLSLDDEGFILLPKVLQ